MTYAESPFYQQKKCVHVSTSSAEEMCACFYTLEAAPAPPPPPARRRAAVAAVCSKIARHMYASWFCNAQEVYEEICVPVRVRI